MYGSVLKLRWFLKYIMSPLVLVVFFKISNTICNNVYYQHYPGLEALKDAGIVTGQGEGLRGWVLPESLQNSTGIVYATSFPALDTAVGEVKLNFHKGIIFNGNSPCFSLIDL